MKGNVDQSEQSTKIRRQAEVIAGNRAKSYPEGFDCLPPEKIMQILHELRVHQVELEIQNEELRQTQSKLEATEARYRDLYDTAPAGYCTLSERGVILEANLTAATLLGVDRDALIRQPITRFILNEDQDIYYLHSKHLFETGNPKAYDLRMVKRDKTPFWAHIEATVTRDTDSDLLIRVMISDISERRHAEKELRESEDRFRTLATLAPSGIYQCDSKGQCQYVNPRWCEMAGLSPNEALGTGWIRGVHPDDREFIFSNWQKMVASKGKWGLEYRFQTPAGKITWVYGLAAPRRDASGNIIGYIGINVDITERRVSEDILRKMSERLDLAQHVARAGVWDWNLVTGHIEWSPQLFEIFGLDPLKHTASFETWKSILYPKDAEIAGVRIDQALKQQVTLDSSYRIVLPDGRIRWINAVGQGKYDKLGCPTRMTGICMDITERKRVEEALLKTQHQLKLIFDTVPALIWQKDREGRYLQVNQAYCRIFGLSEKDILGKTDYDIFPNDVAEKYVSDDQKILNSGISEYGVEEPFQKLSGERGWGVTNKMVYCDDDGHPSGTIGFAIDVTDRKRAERGLRESEALYRSIGESIDYGVWVCTPDGRNTYASESFLKMAGITQEQCSNFGWGNLLHPDDAERTIAAWQECVRTGGKWDIEHRFRGTDGRWHHVLARGVPVKNDQGEIFCWAGFNLDISRLKHAEERLRESLAEKEVLLKEVHHRVKNNLQIISSLVSLQADTLADEQLTGVFNDVRDRVRTMALVHEKLYQSDDLARLDFSEYAHGLLNYLWNSHGAATRNVRLNMSITPVILPVEMVVNCGLILNELAANAIRHAFPHGGGGEVSVTLEHNSATGDTCLCVRDSGVGLPADLDCRQASSLGLRLVKMLTKQIHGSLQTGPGPGAEFQIRFNIKGIPS
ncbi:MAG: PAS domain S-box protein [Desulfatirhabdiaceae bacterium]